MKQILIRICCGLCLFSLFGAGATAYELEKTIGAILPPSYTYRQSSETYMMHTSYGDTPFQMGQISFLSQRRAQSVSGYVIRMDFSRTAHDVEDAYYRLNLSKAEWAGLIRADRMLFDESSELRVAIRDMIKKWAETVYGKLPFEVRLEQIEPYRRMAGKNTFVYVSGARIVISSGAMAYPMYGRAYFFRTGQGLGVLLLITPEEGRFPLVYAMDDAAKAIADEEIFEGNEHHDRLDVILGKDKMKSQDSLSMGLDEEEKDGYDKEYDYRL